VDDKAQMKRAEREFDLQEQIDELNEELDRGRFKVRKGKAKPEDAGIEELRESRDFLRHEIERIVRAETAPKGSPVAMAWNTPKSLISSADVSAAGRQGWFIGLANPDKIPSAFGAQLKAFASPKAAFRIQREIQGRENFRLYKKMKIHFADANGSPEEAFARASFMSKWKRLNPFAGSERAFNTYLNKMRADVADRMLGWAGPNPNDEMLEAMGNYINVFSGRGGASIPGMEKGAEVLNNFLFSARFQASRVDALTGQPLWGGKLKGSGKARALIARQYAQMIGMLGAVYGIAKWGGAEIGTERHSTDYGKIKIGNTRIDPLAGVSQYIVLTSRLLDKKYTDIKGKTSDLVTSQYDSDKFRPKTTGEVGMRFLRSKLHPSAGAVWSLFDKKNYIGEPYGAKEAVQDITLPISAKELVEELRKDGFNEDDAWGLLNFLGIGTNTYEKIERR
jgi:hypothetical protein